MNAYLMIDMSIQVGVDVELTEADFAAAKAAGVDMYDQMDLADWFNENRVSKRDIMQAGFAEIDYGSAEYLGCELRGNWQPEDDEDE